MAEFNRTQIQDILNNAPQGVDRRDVLQGLIDRGHTLEGFNDKIETTSKQESGSGFIEGVKGVAEKAQRVFGQASASAAPLLTAGLISSEDVRQAEAPGMPALGKPEGALEKIGAGAGVVTGIGAQIVPITKTAQAVGKIAQSIKGLKGIGDAIRAGGITTAALEGAIAGALQEGDIGERASQATVGAGIGGVFGGLVKGAKALGKSFSGLDEATETVINPVANLSKQEQQQFIKTASTQAERANKLDNFLSAAEDNARNPRALSAMDLAVDAVDNARTKIKEAKQAAGKVVGSVKKKIGGDVVENASQVVDNFKNKLLERFNIQSIKKTGELVPVKGRQITLDTADQARIGKIVSDLNPLTKKSVTINATDDVKNIVRNNIDFEKAAQKQDKLEALIKEVDSDIVNLQRGASDELAQANQRFSELANIENDLFKATGNKAERAVTILKRALSERGAATKEMFEKIAEETGVDLFEDAMFAKFATEALGGSQSRGVLEQVIESAVSPLGVIERAARGASRIFFKPEDLAREAARLGVDEGTVQELIKAIKKGAPGTVGGVTGATAEDIISGE